MNVPVFGITVQSQLPTPVVPEKLAQASPTLLLPETLAGSNEKNIDVL